MSVNNKCHNKNANEDYSDEHSYSYYDNYGWKNQMYCPYMNQYMNYNSIKMNRKQVERTDNNPDSVNTGDYREPLSWQKKLKSLINKPVGVSLRNGQGVSGVLCNVSNRGIYLLEYLYQTQFATKHYRFDQIQDINLFPKCRDQK